MRWQIDALTSPEQIDDVLAVEEASFSHPWTREMYLSELESREGIASALLARVLQEGASLGARRATLEVRRSNEPARLLYERFGFSIAGVRRAYYSDPIEDVLILWRDGLAPTTTEP